MRFAVAVLIWLASQLCIAQDVAELARHYSGQLHWDADSGTVTFESSGRVDFARTAHRSSIWEVPAAVRRIVIGKGVRAEVAFTVRSSLDIEGGSPAESEIFGTATPALLHDAGLDQGGGCIPYSAVLAEGRGVVVNVRGLTSRNPLGYHFTGKNGAVLHLDHIHAIDDRGGVHNHSDGISAGAGSSVRNSYFETADDVIKVYSDITVSDTTIRMIRNAVPIQLGWGSYGDGARGVFRNLKIVGDSGRNRDFPVINAHAGIYRKTLEFDGLEIENFRATLFRLNEPAARIAVTLRNARISLLQTGLKTAGLQLACDVASTKAQPDLCTTRSPVEINGVSLD